MQWERQEGKVIWAGVVWQQKAISPSQIVEAVTNGTVSVILNSETSQWRSLTYVVRKIEKTGILP